LKITQKSVRAFHCLVTSDEDFFAYFRKNITSLRGYFIILSGNVSDEIQEYLKNENVCFKNINGCEEKIFNINKKDLSLNQTLVENKSENLSSFKEKKVKIYDRSIRSGEDIINYGDLVINGRVNSGAKVKSDSSMIITDKIDGVVECGGEYIILREIGQGVVYFNLEILKLEPSKVLKLIYSEEEKLIVKELK